MNPTLITAEQRAQLLANGHAYANGKVWAHCVVRLFTPDAHATWLLAALDPADGDTAYGLCDVGIGTPELGHVKLSDLASIVGPLKRPILRDLYFRPTRSLGVRPAGTVQWVDRRLIEAAICTPLFASMRCGIPYLRSSHRCMLERERGEFPFIGDQERLV